MADEAKPTDAKPEWETSRDGRPKQFSIPAELVEHILLGPADDRRVLQDSPLLGDVWTSYALDPGSIRDVLITPNKTGTAAGVASIIPKGLGRWDEQREKERNERLKQGQDVRPASRDKEKPKIAYLQGLVGARLYFDEVLCILVPMTQWWHQPQVAGRIEEVGSNQERLKRLLQRDVGKPGAAPAGAENFSSLERYIALAGLIYWIGKLERPDEFKRPPTPSGQPLPPLPPLPPLDFKEAFKRYQAYADEIIAEMLAAYPVVQAISAELTSAEVNDTEEDANAKIEGYIFQVSLNRPASAALERSVPSVKADAAHSLFQVKCKGIVWAVLDSGIDSTHDAFMMLDEKKTTDPKNPQYTSRVRKTFDFTKIREIVSNDETDLTDEDLKKLAKTTGLETDEVQKYLRTIAEDARERRPINWAVVEKLITLKPAKKLPKPKTESEQPEEIEAKKSELKAAASDKSEPDTPEPENSESQESGSELRSPHGTHVAGIIGADQFGYGNKKNKYAGGMCPDIRLYDFRVLGKTLEDTEFAVIAALQYIRYVNERHTYITIHGANLSLSIPHNVRNYACGRTPVCNECERLVESGVVVVAAAGNRGFQKFETKEGIFENYAAFSITDPGNSDSVITVGSTHGNWPQTYGVSFFSSRGPTGDGRQKPDLVAPGERVQSTVLDNEWGPESGTSMAAPHVSGAAAMLLARYEELIGQPRRVKRILCESATDLGRERSFQGHGMLDVLRAFQSI